MNIIEIIGILICESEGEISQFFRTNLLNISFSVILVVRVYYLWSRKRIIQATVCFVTVAALAIALGYAVKSVAVSIIVPL